MQKVHCGNKLHAALVDCTNYEIGLPGVYSITPSHRTMPPSHASSMQSGRRLAFDNRPCSTIRLNSPNDSSSAFDRSISAHACGTTEKLGNDSTSSSLISIVVVFRIPLPSLTALQMLPFRPSSPLYLVSSVKFPPVSSSLSSELLPAGCSHI